MPGRAARWWRVWRLEPYEAAVGVGCLAGFGGIRHGAGSAAVTKVVPHWAWSAVAAAFGLAGVLILGGLIGVAVAVRSERRATARRAEQVGQFLAAGCLAAIGMGAWLGGWSGLVSGAVYCALAAAAATHGIEIGMDFKGREDRE